MNERIKKLREQTINAVPTLSHERAYLITQFYKSGLVQIITTRHTALAFKYILENKNYALTRRLIVENAGCQKLRRHIRTCVHSLNDLEILDTRRKFGSKFPMKQKMNM
jgi:formate C-acetyltransferase